MLEQTNEEKKKKIDTQGLRNAVTNTAEKLYQNKIRDVQAKTNAVQSERVQNAQGANDGKSKSLKDYSIMSPDRQSNGIETDDKPSFDGKKFKSRYIDNNGAWTHEAVDDGYVEFNDYIKDRRDGVDNGISFNGKEFSASSLHPSSEPYENDVLYGNEYVRYDVDEDPIEYYYSEDYDILEPYTISDNLGETAGVLDGIWGGMKNASSSAWNGVKTFGDWATKGTHRAVWRLGAELYLRPKNLLTSAWMLEHSLEENPTDEWRGDDSRIAGLIKKDTDFIKAVDAKIKESNSDVIYTKIEDFPFSKGDLYYSLYHADVYLNGYKRYDGKWILSVRVEDYYDYDRIMTYMGDHPDEFSSNASFGTIMNDAAAVSQVAGAITPYYMTVEFKMER